MAIVTAVKSGHWSDPTAWNTGALPQAGDTARPGAYVVTIDQDIEVQTLESSPGAAGYWSVSLGVTIKANIYPYQSGNFGANGFMRLYHPAGTTVHIIGNVTGSNTTQQGIAIRTFGSGGLEIIGNLTGGNPAIVAHAVFVATAGGPIHVIGDCIGQGTSSMGLYISQNRALTIDGNIYGSPFAQQGRGLALYATLSVPPRVHGNVIGGAGEAAIYLQTMKSKALYIEGDVIPYDDGVPWPSGKWKEAIISDSSAPVIVSGRVVNTSQGFSPIAGPFFVDIAHRHPYVDLPYVDPATDEISLQRYRAGVNPQLTATVQPRPQVVCTVEEGR